MTHRMLALSVGLVLVAGVRPGAQVVGGGALAPLTADDMLKVATASVLDVSDDGRRVALTTRRTFDNAEMNHRRYGDPTYVQPAAVRLMVIDIVSGATQPVLPDLADIRQAAWSHDGSRLAFLQIFGSGPAADATVRLRVWEAARATVRDVALKGDAQVSVNSGLAWSADDARVVVSLRTKQRDAEARARFTALTEGPIIVQSSKDSFLEWDDLSRTAR